MNTSILKINPPFFIFAIPGQSGVGREKFDGTSSGIP